MKKIVVLFQLLFAVQLIHAQPVFDFKYVNIAEPGNGDPRYITPALGKVIFSASETITNTMSEQEPWISDGTPAGTFKLIDINPLGSSNPSGFTEINGKILFTASRPSKGTTLWVTDGTIAGTQQFQDVITNWSPGYFRRNILFNGKIYFTGAIDTTGYHLCVTDGTMAGTQIVKKFTAPYNNCDCNNYTIMNSRLYFTAKDTAGKAILWSTDGTDTGTHVVCDTIHDFYYLFALKNQLLWNDGTALCISDGTPSGTSKLRNLQINSQFTLYNDVAYFAATTFRGREVWRTDGTLSGTYRVKDIYPGNSSGLFEFEPMVYKNRLYFTANDSAHGFELWCTDGTDTGTHMVKDINPGKSDANPKYFYIYRDLLFFAAGEKTGQRQIFFTDGTEQDTRMLIPKNADTSYQGPLFSVSSAGFFKGFVLNPTDSALYFNAAYNYRGNELWSMTYVHPETVSALAFDNAFTIYPNPNNGTFALELDNTNFKEGKIEVYDVLGRIVHSQPINGKLSTVSINRQLNGVHYVRVHLDGEVMTKQLLIE